MYQKTIWTLLIIITLASCKKERFPDTDDLQGTWTEQTDNSAKHALIFDTQTLYFIKPNTVDTLSYRLDKNQDLIYLTLKNNPSAGESNHKMLLNKKSKTLTIWGLFPSIPEQVTETKFEKQ
jgi:hypothetical protein